jgi:hypothetical protein
MGQAVGESYAGNMRVSRKLINRVALWPTALGILAYALVLSPRPSLAQEIEKLKADFERASAGVSLSAFFDVQATNPRNDPRVVSLGDFEMDLARELGRSIQVGAAVVVNNDGASLAVAFVDFHFFGGLIAPRGKLPVEKGFHVQLGQFDVPFGNDWQYFAAKDRTELSAPLTTELIMNGGYNATGLRILGNTGSFNYSALALGGNGPGKVFGGRLGFTPLNNPYQLKPLTHVFEAGASLLHDLDGDGATRETSFALDSEVAAGPSRLRAEYLRKDTRAAEGSGERVIQWGWHVTAAFDAGEVAGVPMTPYARYDTVTKDEGAGADAGRTERLTAGLNAVLFRLVTLKVEYQRILAAPLEVQAQDGFGRDTWLAQVVVVF